MKNSPYKIYCLCRRVSYTFLDENYEMYTRLEEPIPKPMFEKTNEFIKKQCYRIFNEIENSYYTYNDLMVYMIYRTLWDTSVKLVNINHDAIDKFKLQFTERQLETDRITIHKINKEAKMKNIKEYFSIRENGESLIYRLCMREIISIYFFMYYADSLLTGFFGRMALKERNKDYKKFHETMKILIRLMNVKTFTDKQEE